MIKKITDLPLSAQEDLMRRIGEMHVITLHGGNYTQYVRYMGEDIDYRSVLDRVLLQG